MVRDAHVPLSAYGVSERLPSDSGRVHLSAIFRALGELMDAGSVRRIECVKGYVATDEAVGITLLCQECGGYAELTANDVREKLERLARFSSFEPLRLVVEVVGRCQTCLAADTPYPQRA